MKDTTEYIERAAQIYAEFKHPTWREYQPRQSKAADQRKLFAIALNSDWRGNSTAKINHLLKLLPRAVEQAARMEVWFNSRTTIWSCCRSAQGLERLAGGIVPGESGRGWDAGDYDAQVIRIRLPEDLVSYVRAEAENQGLSCSALVTRIIENWLEAA